jgi:hypothetical protein
MPQEQLVLFEIEPTEELVYGELQEDCLVFMTRENAEKFAGMNKAIRSAERRKMRWENFKKKYPDLFEELYQAMESSRKTFEEWLEETKNKYGWSEYSSEEELFKAEMFFRNKVPDFQRVPFMDEPVKIQGDLIDFVQSWLEFTPQQRMYDVIPDELQDKYGTIEESWSDGEFLYLSCDDEEILVWELQLYGYRCTRDDKLICKACGWE